ncbi:MAG: histidine kinase, partial [Acidimicrobiales bacterium]|nr:histidine kinase [Acidimicrobiales bacterium]
VVRLSTRTVPCACAPVDVTSRLPSKSVNGPWMVAIGCAVAIRSVSPFAALGLLALVGVPVQVGWYLEAQQPPFAPFPAMLLVVYALATATTGRQRLIALVAIAIANAVPDLAAFASGRAAGDTFVAWVFITIAWVLGTAMTRRQRYAESESERANRLERERDIAVANAAEAERARIARELHDVITHTVSGMVVQASVEARGLEPGETRDVLTAIEGAGREALVELRRLLGVLRHGDHDHSLAPQPGLAQLEALIRDSQLPASLHLEGEPTALAPGVDLSLFRTVQEGLTNVRKHARGVSSVEVRVRAATDALEIEVRDDGDSSTNTTPGFGLIGLRERVALHGGQLQAGHIDPRGYRLWVRLPVEGQ